MPAWNSGQLWSSGTLWGPSPSPVPVLIPNNATKRKTMKRQVYYPKRLSAQPEWHSNYADRLLEKVPMIPVI